MEIVRTDSSNKEFQQLVAFLDAGLKIIDGDDAPFFAQYNKIDSIKNVVVVYKDAVAISCGAFKEYEPKVAEIKRMFTREENRGQGVAVIVLDELEKWAAESGFEKAILETGDKMTAAIRLYEKSGYGRIPNYGQYADVESSVCMEKELKKD